EAPRSLRREQRCVRSRSTCDAEPERSGPHASSTPVVVNAVYQPHPSWSQAMTVIETLIGRNADFVAHRFPPGLKLSPTLKTMLIGCVDPRVDPSLVLGLQLGEAAIIRNVGGRVTPATLKTMAMLGRVGQANGGGPRVGWNLVVLHHTDCGM